MTRQKSFSPSHLFSILAFVSIALYATYQTRDLLRGPSLMVESPLDGTAVDTSRINVRGMVNNISKLYLNGRQIFSDTNQRFNEPLLLAYGYNIIEVKAEDQFGRQIKKTISLVLR
ncbi:MAG: hypothetical protein AAB468_01935 [Patescibacteria group bacterium]